MQSIPETLSCAADYEAEARLYMDEGLLGFAAGGAGQEETLNANLSAFQACRIYNRVLTDVSAGSTKTSLLGQAFAHPMLLAPIGFQKLYSDRGEIETAQAADATDTGMIVSTLSSVSLSEIAEQTQAPLWFQLYCQPRMEDTLHLVRQAETTGHQALVITVDTPVQMMTPAARRAGFKMPPGVEAVNTKCFEGPPQRQISCDDSLIFQGAMADAPGWNSIERIVIETELPVLLKGITHPEDAVRAMEAGAKGVIVSNHGGRALDGGPASLTALPAIRSALGDRATILADGGIRSGSDVFKALARGADAVLIGRLQIYALSVCGALGVGHMLKLMREELELTMALAGAPTLTDITPNSLVE